MTDAFFDSPVGPIRVRADHKNVVLIEMGSTLAARLARGGTRPDGKPSPLAREARRQLEQYFAGRRTRFDLPCRPTARPFTSAILRQVARIPYGEATTYGDLACAAGNPRAARAAGQAVGANPLPILIPCHRVLAANGRLGGFGCGLEVKRFLLTLERIDWREATPA